MPQFPAQGRMELQTINLISQEEGKSQLDIGYRIPRSFFVFTRDSPDPSDRTLTAQGDLLIEVLDTSGSSVAQRDLHLELAGTTEASQQTDSLAAEGITSFTLPPGGYTLAIELDDNNSSRKLKEDSRKVRLKKFGRDTLELSDILFCDREQSDKDQLVPYNIGGDIPFSHTVLCFAEISPVRPEDTLEVSYAVSHLDPNDNTPRQVLAGTVPQAALAPARGMTPVQEKSGAVRYAFSDTLPARALSCSFELDADTLPLGTYEVNVHVRSGSRSADSRKKFQTRWEGMPFSLRQLKFAIDAMVYIVPQDSFDRVRTADAATQRTFFDEYWKRRDPTPHTAYNEVMAEYFKRADYAFSNFNTLREQNGVRTERGKAYILYGPPTSVERRLLPSSDPEEIWIYANLHKKLIFVDEHHNGSYRLIAAEAL